MAQDGQRERPHNNKSVPPKTPAPRSIRSFRTLSAGKKRVTVLTRTPRDLKRALESEIYAPSPVDGGARAGAAAAALGLARSPLGNITNGYAAANPKLDGKASPLDSKKVRTPRSISTPKSSASQLLPPASRRKESMLPPSRLDHSVPVEDEPTRETPSEMVS